MSRPRLCIGALLAVLVLLLACNRNIEPFADDPVEKPDLSRIFPEAAQRDVVPPDRPPPPPPGRGPRGAPPAVADSGPPIRGVVRVAPELAGRIPSGAVLFIVARSGDAGPPTAVLRVPASGFPTNFEIGSGNRMIQAMPWQGPFRLSARVDADGNASTRAGDFQGVAKGTYAPGASGVEIVIDHAL